MIICGIDPGVAIVGFGILEKTGQNVKALSSGVIRTEAGLPIEERLEQIYNDISELFERYKPEVLAIEELFFNKNVNTGLPVAHARGVLLLAARQRKITVFSYSPQQVKQAVTGYGKAEKNQVMEMTKRLLGLAVIPKPDDAADALAVALCHSTVSGSLLRKH